MTQGIEWMLIVWGMILLTATWLAALRTPAWLSASGLLMLVFLIRHFESPLVSSWNGRNSCHSKGTCTAFVMPICGCGWPWPVRLFQSLCHEFLQKSSLLCSTSDAFFSQKASALCDRAS